jgi:hypothetical protein
MYQEPRKFSHDSVEAPRNKTKCEVCGGKESSGLNSHQRGNLWLSERKGGCLLVFGIIQPAHLLLPQHLSNILDSQVQGPVLGITACILLRFVSDHQFQREIWEDDLHKTLKRHTSSSPRPTHLLNLPFLRLKTHFCPTVQHPPPIASLSRRR